MAGLGVPQVGVGLLPPNLLEAVQAQAHNLERMQGLVAQLQAVQQAAQQVHAAQQAVHQVAAASAAAAAAAAGAAAPVAPAGAAVAAAAERAVLLRAAAAAIGARGAPPPPPGLAAAAAASPDLVVRQAAAAAAAATAAAAAVGASPTAPAAASSSAAAAAAAEAAASLLPEAEEVPRCHLHRKLNKACKYCKAHAQYQEVRSKEIEDRKSAALERLKGGAGGGAGGSRGGGGSDDKVAVPNLTYFPQVLRDRILASNFYSNVLLSQEISEVRDQLLNCDSCEPEVRGLNLDTAPSQFISIVYRLLNAKLTEGQLRGLLMNKNRYVRCAGFVYVRMGVHQDRYWELLSDALLDIEEFVPFPGKGGEKMSEGQFVEQLLTKEKYCDVSLPRIAVAQRKMLNERLVLYDQFRKRYSANLEVVEERFSDPEGGVQVEVCNYEGEWSTGETVGPASSGTRRVSVPVRFAGDEGQNVSIGFLIAPPSKGSSADPSDLTRSRGRSYQELLERHRAQQKDAAVASGKDYCKNSGRRTVHAGGMTFIAGENPKDPKEKRKRDSEESDEEAKAREARRSREKNQENEAKMAAIMEKYMRGPTDKDKSQSKGGAVVEGPDRMRLG